MLGDFGAMGLKKIEIKRQDIKYNFLKKIILRFDFQGMDESELESVVNEVSILLKEKECGYISKRREVSNSTEYYIEDPESNETEGLYTGSAREQYVYVFENKNPQVKLKISSSFVVIAINKTKYVDCLEYCDTLLKIMNKIKEMVPFFSCLRFGIRKINQCYLFDKDKLNKYFEKSHFQIYSYGKDSRIKVSEKTDHMFIGDYNLNLIRTVVYGQIYGKDAYKINYDSDLYLLGNEEIAEVLKGGISKIEVMNNILFDLYKDAITIEFLNELIDGSYNENEIDGVMKNE